MAANARERESKFDVSDDFELPSIGRMVSESSVKLTATYWDTRDRRLLRWRQTLRYREASDGSENGWTLKLTTPPGASSATPPEVLDREEIHATGTAESPPAELSALVLGVVRGESLLPAASIETDRLLALVLRADGRAEGLVELSDDRVSSTVDGEPGPAFRQIEVEAKNPGSDRLLKEASERLSKEGATATRSTKLEKVLGGRPDPEVVAPSLRKGSSVNALARFAIASGAARLIGHDPAVRLGLDAEAVHQARVATRRLRSDLKTLEPLLELAPVQRLRDDLAWVGGLLGAVRDLDVLIGRVEEQARRLPHPDSDASALIVATLRKDRGLRRSELLDELGSARYVGLLTELVEASRVPPLTSVSGKRRARSVLRKLVRKAWRRTARGVARLDDRASDADLHEIRKRSKRARYAAELGHGVFGRHADRMAKHLAELQDVLGELQDTVVAEERLRSLAVQRLAGAPAFAAGALACLEHDARADARDRWPHVWKAARKKRLRRWLG